MIRYIPNACMKGKYILTPPPLKMPRINGARIFGVRPQSPFLFQIAATGEPPLIYGVQSLPKGLEIDPTSGLITGTIEKEGEYTCKVSVTNKEGTAERDLLIKVGEEICLTPPMGWNSWYCQSESVSEEQIKRTALTFKEKGLIAHGWTYVNIDDCWQGTRGGKLNSIQTNKRFADMKGLCDFIHDLGLKAGIYSTPWMSSYAGFIGGSAPNTKGDLSKLYMDEEKRLQNTQFFGRYPGGKKLGLFKLGKHHFTEKDAKQWAIWGFDYVKYDWNPNDIPTTRRIAKELRNSGRDIILSLSNSTPFDVTPELSKIANLWRTSGDIIDYWFFTSRIGFSQEKWQQFTRPGHWNDPDMLQIGRLGTPNSFIRKTRETHLSPTEQYTQMSLWCLLSAPLLLSCAIEELDDFTLNLITNDEVLEVNQDPLGAPASRMILSRFRQLEVWKKELEDGSHAIAIFNRLRFGQSLSLDLNRIGISDATLVRDLWRQKDIIMQGKKLRLKIPAHGVQLLKIS